MKLWDFELKFGTWNLKFWDLGFWKLRPENLITKSGVWISFLKCWKLNSESLKLEILKDLKLEILKNWNLGFWKFVTWNFKHEIYGLKFVQFENLKTEGFEIEFWIFETWDLERFET